MARPTLSQPTARQRLILELVARRIADGEPSPSMPEIATLIGVKSPGSARYAAISLEALGLLGRIDATDRFFVPTADGWRAVGIVPPADAPVPLVSPAAAVLGAVTAARDAGELLPPRVVAALEAVPA